MTDPKPRCAAAQFAAPTEACDLIMKGGVTSGLVYPYAVLQLAQQYRFRSIGGTSVGAIAAAFAAAAEYGRQAGDPGAFVRFEARCLQIPTLLEGLFQPSAPFEPLMRAVSRWSAGRGLRRWTGALAPFAPTLGIGLAVGVGLMAALGWLAGGGWSLSALPGVVLGAALGALAALVWRLARLFLVTLPAHRFGLCGGMAPEGSPPVLTDWIHRSLQFIAFGREEAGPPLTFGHLARIGLDAAAIGRGERNIDLRMMTTNLSMRRPHALPDLGGAFLFEPEAWRRLFPATIAAYLEGPSPHADREVAPRDKEFTALRRAPAPEDWPVIAAVRMSLSFPILFETVPMLTRDLAPAAPDAPPAADYKPSIGLAPVLFSDGGLSSNFPIHFFDALLPTRPTFALSLDRLGPKDDPDERVSMPQTAAAGSFTSILPIEGLMGFAAAILGAAKDWQDQMLSVMPGQRERIVHVRLSAEEGGLNLAMPPATSARLMAYGDEAGALIRAAFDFDEHRWRRMLVAYEQFQATMERFGETWPGYGAWLAAYAPLTYPRAVGKKAAFGERFGAFAEAAADFTPPIGGDKTFPHPTGRLRIVPDV